MNTEYPVEFLTATILKWQKLLGDDSLKQVIVNSLQWLTKENRCKVYVFVIMPNHIHLLWQIEDTYKRKEVQGALFSHTAHEFQKILRERKSDIVNNYFVNYKDRSYQFWQRNPMVKECQTEYFFLQKMNYIHWNPCQPHWNLASCPEEYPWSSASYYEKNNNRFEWLTHYFG
jgi:REP element-mobilizing transposase RayT